MPARDPKTPAKHFMRPISEQHFQEGISAGKAGLSRATCPYVLDVKSDAEQLAPDTARMYWVLGWNLNEFERVLRARVALGDQLRKAIATLLQLQGPYQHHCATEELGLFRGGLGYLRSRGESRRIANQIRESNEIRLLEELHFDLYLPWHKEARPYRFVITDQLLAIFGGQPPGNESVMQDLMRSFGDRFGVREAWHLWLAKEEVQDLLPVIE